MNEGWFGDPELVKTVLAEQGAQKDEDGNFLIYGEAPFVGMDGDVVISDATECIVSGERRKLATLMRESGYGVPRVVIF